MDGGQSVLQKALTTILFDMDNTLFDLVGAQIAACHAVTASLGRNDGESLFADYFMKGHHGFENHENIRDYLTDRSLPINENFQPARVIYERVKLDQIVAYPGVRETLFEIRQRGYRMGIITDAHSRDANRRLERSGLLQFFDGLVSYDMVMIKKPAPEPFLVALEMMGAVPKSTLLVGDSPRRDIRPARDLGICTVYARYGDRFSLIRECPEADFIINRMDELPGIIRSRENGE
jgi:putative hydrolase of the HAD superfamily